MAGVPPERRAQEADGAYRGGPRPEHANHLRLASPVAEDDRASNGGLDRSVLHERMVAVLVVYDQTQRGARPAANVVRALDAPGGPQGQPGDRIEPNPEGVYRFD